MIATAALAGVPVTTIALPVDWTSAAAMIEPLAADLLVCYAFPLLVPPEILTLFPQGGVNFHPALLPQYRGPNPVRCMVADGTWQAHGGMTLHIMTGRYDEGEILADVPFLRTAWKSAAHLRAAAAAAMADMVVEAIPLYCAGRLRPRSQPTGDFAYARYVPRVVTVRPDWTADHVAAAGAWLTSDPGLFVETEGRRVRIGRLLRCVGPPTGRQPNIRPLSVELDCVDARVAVARGHWAAKIVDRFRQLISRRTPEVEVRPIRYDRLGR
jgi:methionyl-tRNA formyltransferase